MRTQHFLPVRPHLRPKPRRNLLANAPADALEKVPAFVRALERCMVYERINPADHPCGWGYDIVGSVSLEEALSLPFW
jgi:hypothetical protein